MAKAATKEPVSDQIMTPGEMKPLLALSKREPVQAAIGITGDGDGIILLDKKLKPRQVLARLKADAQKSKIKLQPATLRFGKAEVDADYDPGMVRFFVNKEAPGNMRMKLLEIVKRVPYQKVELNVQPSLEDESEDEVEGQTADPVRTTAAAPPPPPPGPPPPPSVQPKYDLKTMTNALGQLMLAIPKVADGDEGLRKSFVVLATSAQASLKLVEGSQTPESLSKAGQDLEMLKHALAEAMEQAKLRAQAQAGAGPVVYAKSRLAWLATRKRLESDISRLESEIVATYEDEGVGQDLASAYATWVGPMLSALDDRLANALDAAANATNAVERTKLVADAKTLIAQYTAFLNSDPRIAELDDNPFLPLAIRSTVGGTLSTLAKAIV